MNSGDNVTVHCDCKLDTGVYIVWYRNCSHVNQPTLVLKTRLGSMAGPTTEAQDAQKIFHRYHIVKNNTSDTYDLLIRNVSDCDEGFYYCGTEERDVMSSKYQNLYGNITTRLILSKCQTFVYIFILINVWSGFIHMTNHYIMCREFFYLCFIQQMKLQLLREELMN